MIDAQKSTSPIVVIVNFRWPLIMMSEVTLQVLTDLRQLSVAENNISVVPPDIVLLDRVTHFEAPPPLLHSSELRGHN